MRVFPALLVAVLAGVFAVSMTGAYVHALDVGDSPTDDALGNSTVDPPSLDDEAATETLACPPGAGATVRDPVDEPGIVELYPDPTTEDNVGEYAVLETPAETNVSNWTLTDGHTTAAFPNETVDGRVALTVDADATATLTDEEPLELEGHLRLAAAGDELELREGETTIDAVSYDRAPPAEIWYRDGGALERTPADEFDGDGGSTAGSNPFDDPARGTWWPRDATCVAPTTGSADDATAFVLPDAPDVATEAIAGADDRILLGGYTFTSEPVTAELLAAVDRGVEVRVLVESGPVGGTPAAAESVLADLEAGGVEVRAIGGEGGRYDFHHPKYAVVDESVLVTSENWKPSGIGGDGSRGWGVTLDDAELAAALAAVFRADFAGRDTEAGDRFRERTTFVADDDRPERAYPAEFEPETVPVESTELLVAPDNAENRLVDLIEGAEEELLVKQARLGGTDVSLVDAAVEAARRGVDVRILLDSSWYVEEENRAMATELERIADEEDLSIDVELVDPDGRFEKIHAKGVVIDGETAVVGSVNWNENALENNREVLLVLHGEAVAEYYATVFEADWGGASRPLPVEFALAVVAALVAAAFVGHRYVEFGDERSPPSAGSFGGESGPRGGVGVPNVRGVRPDTISEGSENVSLDERTDGESGGQPTEAGGPSVAQGTIDDASVTVEPAETDRVESTSGKKSDAEPNDPAE